eukprot:TRINITY_DN42491_c0_g1_i2.p3 TRINITY_DN42491_c0_g1~~TRINITY_DN42491_c0_g1_i2.p3  ORF type:complete len:103 (+),score=26.48 TRINITY_DN42491_c0_g1_i2:62-370(+)
MVLSFFFFFFQAEDGIRDVERSRGLGDVYKRQTLKSTFEPCKNKKSQIVFVSSLSISPANRHINHFKIIGNKLQLTFLKCKCNLEKSFSSNSTKINPSTSSP